MEKKKAMETNWNGMHVKRGLVVPNDIADRWEVWESSGKYINRNTIDGWKTGLNRICSTAASVFHVHVRTFTIVAQKPKTFNLSNNPYWLHINRHRLMNNNYLLYRSHLHIAVAVWLTTTNLIKCSYRAYVLRSWQKYIV